MVHNDPHIGPQDDESLPGQQYGTAIALDNDGDLKMNGRGGFARVHDDDAVIQDAKFAVLTPNGADPIRDWYGRILSELLGSNFAAFRSELERIVEGDPRIDRVMEIDVDFDGNRSHVKADMTVQLVDGELRGFGFSSREFPRNSRPDYRKQQRIAGEIPDGDTSPPS